MPIEKRTQETADVFKQYTDENELKRNILTRCGQQYHFPKCGCHPIKPRVSQGCSTAQSADEVVKLSHAHAVDNITPYLGNSTW